MNIKTKKFNLEKKIYIKIALTKTLLQTWWVFAILVGIMFLKLFFNSILILLLPIIGIVLYIGFWLLQFYGVTVLEQSKLLFEKVSYEINPRQIIIQLSNKQGVPIEWKQIKKAYHSNKGFILMISRAHFIYLPHKAFNNNNVIKLFETLLKRKKLIK